VLRGREASERFTDGMCNFGPISQPGVQAPVADGVSASHAWFYRWEVKASKTVAGPTLDSLGLTAEVSPLPMDQLKSGSKRLDSAHLQRISMDEIVLGHWVSRSRS